VSRLVGGSAPSSAVGGSVDFTVYLPDGYDVPNGIRYPSLYMLHGRGDTMSGWAQEAGALDELIASGAVPRLVVVMPDAPWSERSGFYVDSLFTGSGTGVESGAAVETALTTELVPYIDSNYKTLDDRAARIVGGNSMGGAGAVRYALTYQDLFSAALALSPAAYVPSPPSESSTRRYGAYGVGDRLFDQDRYDALNYPAALAVFNPALPVHLFIGVGDREYVHPMPEEAIHDLDYEAATLYNRAKRVPGLTAEFRVYGGGHDWLLWDEAFRDALTRWAALR
jgi:enterochelin esterase-like enzyme